MLSRQTCIHAHIFVFSTLNGAYVLHCFNHVNGADITKSSFYCLKCLGDLQDELLKFGSCLLIMTSSDSYDVFIAVSQDKYCV
jgi:hypothetical protein